jgi:hypothetical protein
MYTTIRAARTAKLEVTIIAATFSLDRRKGWTELETRPVKIGKQHFFKDVFLEN